ncbi:DUF7503 family protein [Halomicrococcus sp. NG-SE-24]
MTDESLPRNLATNPRIIGVLSTMLLLLAHVGSVSAGVGTLAVYGP